MDKFAELGFGIMRMPMIQNEIDWIKSVQMIQKYMVEDFCYFDMHPSYMMGKAQEIVKRLVVDQYPRETYCLANKMPYWSVYGTRDYEIVFSDELSVCGVEYFDFYMLHAITQKVYELHKRLGGFEFIQKKKAEGYIKNIGISFHDKPELLDQILTEHPELDFVQLQINFLDWDSPVICSRQCYEVARKHNKMIMVMEPIKGGSLAKEVKINEGLTISSEEMAEKSLSFVANLPGVAVILSGMSEVAHVIENRRTIEKVKQEHRNASDMRYVKEPEEYEWIRHAIKENNSIQCTNCRYCTYECPKEIAIPDIISLVNSCLNHGKYDITYAGRHAIFYKGYIKSVGKASDCIQCGKCEDKCPQKIEIRKHMKTAVDLFEEESDITSKKISAPQRYIGKQDSYTYVLWGTGRCFKRHLSKVEALYPIKYVCDNDSTKWEQEIVSGITCISPDQLKKMENTFVILMLERADITMQVVNQLLDIGICNFDSVHNWVEYF